MLLFDDRLVVTESDIESVSHIALRMRQSSGLTEFMRSRRSEDDYLAELSTRLRRQNGEDPSTESTKRRNLYNSALIALKIGLHANIVGLFLGLAPTISGRFIFHWF